MSKQHPQNKKKKSPQSQSASGAAGVCIEQLIPVLLANTQTCYEEHKHVALFGVWCGC